MRTLLFLLTAFLFTQPLQAQLTINDANAELRTVPSFQAVKVSHAIDVILTQGAEEAVAVSASRKEDVASIRTTVENGVLHIWAERKPGGWIRNEKLRAYVSAKQLNRLQVSGASKVTVEGSVRSSQLALDLSGASKITGRFVVDGKFNIDLSGASDARVSGSATEVVVDASGASDMKGFELVTSNCSIEASGASSVHIAVEKELSARLSGASSVRYKGSAMIRDIQTSGASSISRRS
jgi:hypothetical protein